MKKVQVTITITCDGTRAEFPDERCPSKLILGPVTPERVEDALRDLLLKEGWWISTPRCPRCMKDLGIGDAHYCPKCKAKEVMK